MPHWPTAPWSKNPKYDLSNITALMKALGDPHLRLPPVIHIAGTNGKGSSVAMLKAIFEAAGYKVHSYTSPHLLDFNERIVLAGEKISDDYLFDICERTRQKAAVINRPPAKLVSEEQGLRACDAQNRKPHKVREDLSLGATTQLPSKQEFRKRSNIEPRFFEAITAAAFLAFSEVEADILLLETGLGGRLDATNIVENPLLTIITPISYDHMEYLGPTLQLIAGEKAGIIKAGVPCVVSRQEPEVYPVFLEKCEEVGAKIFMQGYDFDFQKTEDGFLYLSKDYSMELPAPALAGDHQLINAATVVAAISLINQHFKINVEQIGAGLKKTSWPARLQKIDLEKYSHLTGKCNIDIWVDGAHNAGGAQILADWIKANLSDSGSDIYLIMGLTKNRNIEGFCATFKGVVKKIIAVRVLSEPSSYGSEFLAEQISNTGIESEPADSLEEAIKQVFNHSVTFQTLEKAQRQERRNDGEQGTWSSDLPDADTRRIHIIVTGSLFLAADFFQQFTIAVN